MQQEVVMKTRPLCFCRESNPGCLKRNVPYDDWNYSNSRLCNYVIINIYQTTSIWFPFMSLCTLKISPRGHNTDSDAAFVHTRSYEEHTYLSGLNCWSPLVMWFTNSLTFNNCTLCPHCINEFCIYLRTATCATYIINWLVYITEYIKSGSSSQTQLYY